MKKTYKIISYLSISTFLILWISSKFLDFNEYNNVDIRSLFVIIYLFSSLKYYQLESKEKDAIIATLKKDINQK